MFVRHYNASCFSFQAQHNFVDHGEKTIIPKIYLKHKLTPFGPAILNLALFAKAYCSLLSLYTIYGI